MYRYAVIRKCFTSKKVGDVMQTKMLDAKVVESFRHVDDANNYVGELLEMDAYDEDDDSNAPYVVYEVVDLKTLKN